MRASNILAQKETKDEELTSLPSVPKMAGSAQTPQDNSVLATLAYIGAMNLHNATEKTAARSTGGTRASHATTSAAVQAVLEEAYKQLPCSLFLKALSLDEQTLYDSINGAPLSVAPTRSRGKWGLSGKTDQMKRSPASLGTPNVSSFFEQSLNEEFIWRSGSVYTPPSLSSQIVKQVFSQSPQLHMNRYARIIDPACGSGSFLEAILNHYLKVGLNQGAIVHLLVERLFGVDRTSLALDVAEFCLLYTLTHHFPRLASRDLPRLRENSLIQDDYLIPSPRLASTGLTDPNSMDCVVGNPPFGLSRDGRIPTAEVIALKRLFRDTMPSKVNTYLLFLAAGFDSLKTSGVMALITPNAWLGIRSGKRFRKQLLDQGALIRIESHPQGLFPERGVETVTVYLQKAAHRSSIALASIEDPREPPRSLGGIHTVQCLQRPAHTIPLRWSDELHHIFAQMAEGSVSLGDPQSPFRPAIALQEYAVGQGQPPQTKAHSRDRVYHSFEPGGDSWVPFLLGKDVQRYQVDWSGTYLHYGDWLAQPGKRVHYELPRVIVREVTAARPNLLRCCAVDYPLFYNRSLLHILIDKPSNQSLIGSAGDQALALSALLNSTVTSAFVYFHGRKAQRNLFPKVVCDDLKDILIPPTFHGAVGELARYVRTKQGADRDIHIDKLVADLYGLSTEQITILKRMLAT